METQFYSFTILRKMGRDKGFVSTFARLEIRITDDVILEIQICVDPLDNKLSECCASSRSQTRGPFVADDQL